MDKTEPIYDEQPKSERTDTIINAYERLKKSYHELCEVANRSKTLIDKLNRTDRVKGIPDIQKDPKELKGQKNIVQMLNCVSEDICTQTEIIRKNLNNSISMIG